MLKGTDYINEVKKFTTSQYWNTGVRITAGVMLPTIVLADYDWLAAGMPFLWGSLFASLTDAPGPIHHRRNGLLAAIVLNSFTVFVTILARTYQPLLVVELVTFTFFFSLLAVYGTRAGAVGSLALVIMMINLVPHSDHENIWRSTLLIAAGGGWCTLLSLLLHQLRPYRIVEQAIGENLIDIADYVRARAAFYKDDIDMEETFDRVMREQMAVLKSQELTQELIFKTRQFVADPSPKSRSLMMIFLDSIDLFEHTMSSYQDYDVLRTNLKDTGVLNKFYGVVLRIAAELEHIGISVQAGSSVKRQPDLTIALSELQSVIESLSNKSNDAKLVASIEALGGTLNNLKNIANRMHRLILYTRLEVALDKSQLSTQDANRMAASQPIKWQLIRENFSLKSNNFRHALRLTIAIIIGYSVSAYFSLSHTYWVLLTVVTILKPVYTVSRKRNIERLLGTLSGVLVASVILYFIKSSTALLIILIFCMAVGYSLLRMNYFGFVLFLTTYILITFHFLNPAEFKVLIKARLIDTVIGSIIAAIASRFILPQWGHEEIEDSMRDMLEANRNYFTAVWNTLSNKDNKPNTEARKNVMVALTNLADNFQRMLSEPHQTKHSEKIHQFVIANHMLTGHIAALSNEKYSAQIITSANMESLASEINSTLLLAERYLKNHYEEDNVQSEALQLPLANQSLNQLSIIHTLVRDIKLVAYKL